MIIRAKCHECNSTHKINKFMYPSLETGKPLCVSCAGGNSEYSMSYELPKTIYKRTKPKTRSIEYRMWTQAKSRAKLKGVPFEIEASDISIPDLCPILGCALIVGNKELAPSLDRVIPNKGYVVGNIAVISNRANTLKNNALVEELESIVNYIKEHKNRTPINTGLNELPP